MDWLFLGEQKNADRDPIHPCKQVENEFHYFFGLNKLEFDYLLYRFLKIKIVVVVTTLQEENGIVQVVKSWYFLILWLLSQTSYLLTDYEVLEIHI